MPLRPSDCKPARSTGTQRRFSCFGDNERQPLDIEQTSSLKSAMKDGAENMSTVSQFPLAEGGVDPDSSAKAHPVNRSGDAGYRFWHLWQRPRSSCRERV